MSGLIADVERALREQLAELENWKVKTKELLAEEQRLTNLDPVNASLWWKADKYLYLIHPMVDGQRKREYIGADVDAVNKAMERVKLWRERENVRHDLQELQTKVQRVAQGLRYSSMSFW